MSRTAIMSGVAALTVGAAVLLPLPAQSSAPVVPPTLPSFEGDFIIPAPGTPRTKMPSVVQVRGKTTYKAGVYDVHVLAIPTAAGSQPWDEAEARRQVEAMDSWYSTETSGLFRFRLAGYQVLTPYPGDLCGLLPSVEHAQDAIALLEASPGATDVLPVMVGLLPKTCTDKIGQANLGSPNSWVGSVPGVAGVDESTLWHEIGHNLGLLHSAAITAEDISQPWAPGMTPEIEEYGNWADTMGMGGQWSCTGTSCEFHLSGLHSHNRNLLGSLAEDEIGFVGMPSLAGESEVLELVSDEAGIPGTQAIYLPWLNRSKFLVEYRPARGLDRYLDDPGGPGSGVHVHLINTDLARGPSPYPATDRQGGFGTVAFPSGIKADEYSGVPIGFKMGQSTLLPDGTRIEVLATTADKATIRISRPVDSQPPTMTPPLIQYTKGQCRSFPCTVPVTAASRGMYKIWLGYGVLDDNQWVDYAEALVNGKRLLWEERATPDGTDQESSFTPGSSGWGHYEVLAPGTYTLAYSYRDLAGNVGTASYQITLPKPKKKATR